MENKKININELKENLINDFQDYLDENNLQISFNWIVNENYINNYLMSIFYNIQDNIDTEEQDIEEIQNEFFEILDDFCCTLPF